MSLRYSSDVFRLKKNNQNTLLMVLLCCGLFFCSLNNSFSQYRTQPQPSSEPVLPPIPPEILKKMEVKNQGKENKYQSEESEETQRSEEGEQTTSIALAPDTLYFGGIRWLARNTLERGEPANNIFSGKSTEVFVDEKKYLHLLLHNRDGIWYGIDIAADTSLGYGTYAVFAETKFDALPANVMVEFAITTDVAMDVYSQAQMAIQITRIQQENSISPLRFLVSNTEQGMVAEHKEKIFRSEEPFHMQGLFSTHAITWKPRSVEFACYHDHGLPTKYPAAIWDFTGSVTAGVKVPEYAHKNVMRLRLWSIGAPIDDKPIELLIKKIQFIPAQK